MDGIDELDLPGLGPKFEHHPIFPRRTNTEFVEVISSDKIRMRVWERGAGETLANGHTGRSLDVELRGGVLHIDWDKSDGHVYMTGGAVTVFEGVYFI